MIFINSKCRVNKVRTNIVVDKKKYPTRSHQPLHGVEVRNRLYLLLQEIDQERVQEPPGIKSHPAVPWFFASSPLVRRGTVYNTLRFRHQSIGLDQKKKLHRSLAGHCDHLAIPYFSAEHGSCLSRQSDPPTFCQKNPKFLDTSNLQLQYYYPLGESLSTVVKRSSLFNNTEKRFVTTKLLKSWCTIFVARKRSQDAAISHTSFQSSWTSIYVNFLTNSPKTLPPLWENLLPADFSC